VGQVDSAAVARPTKKPRKGELHRLHIILPAEMVDLIDRLAAGMERGPLGLHAPTRTEAIRLLLFEGLKKRGLLK
jgi:hypothetical protein